MRQTRLLDGDALVLTSALWQTNAIAVRAGDALVLVDSVVLPDEVRALPRPDALLATHAHFDHLLGTAAFPELPLHAGPDTVALLREDPDAPARELAERDAELYLERAAPLRLDRLADAGDLAFERVDAPGHAADGSAFLEPERGLLLPGDYLIEVEIPLISQAGSREAYLATLDRLAPLVERAHVVVPGHGPTLGRARARELLDLDRRYVERLEDGALRGGGDHRQRRIHVDNLRKHGHART
ncbi:MAG TPA: MBL fold metallo-hydrolase [Solirubrobacteraceae bacterium]|nr:MBL fold metallo-hydrolase [Solirubrobacteraceae bacterium]